MKNRRCCFFGLAVLMFVSATAGAVQDPFADRFASVDLIAHRVDSWPGQPVPPSYPGSPSYPPTQPGYSYQSPDQLMTWGMQAYRQGDYRTAANWFTQLVDRYPYEARAGEASFMAGESLRAAQSWYDAIRMYRRCTSSYSTYARVDEAAYYIGFCLVKVNDSRGAINEFRDFINRYRYSALVDNAWYVLGRTYEVVGERDNAMQAYRTVISSYPNSDMVADARQRLQALEQSYPPSYPPTYPPTYPPSQPPYNQLTDRELYDRGHTEMTRGNFRNAVQYFDELLRTWPSSYLADDAQLWKGKAWLEAREYRQAIDAFALFRSRFSQSEQLYDAWYSLAWAEYKLGLNGYADRVWLQRSGAEFAGFASRFGGHGWASEALFMAGDAYERYGDLSTARAYWQQTIDRYPYSASAGKAREKLKGYY